MATNKDMKLELLDNVSWRLYSDLTNAKSTNEEFGNVLRAIYGVADLRNFILNNEKDVDPEPEQEAPQEEQKTEVVEAPVPAEEEIPFTVSDNHAPAPAPAPAPEAEKPTDNGIAYERKDVMDALKQARKAGIAVSDIIRSFGVDNFGDIDASQYPVIMEQLRKEGAI